MCVCVIVWVCVYMCLRVFICVCVLGGGVTAWVNTSSFHFRGGEVVCDLRACGASTADCWGILRSIRAALKAHRR